MLLSIAVVILGSLYSGKPESKVRSDLSLVSEKSMQPRIQDSSVAQKASHILVCI